MATRKKHTPEQIVRKLATADRMPNEGKDVADVCRALQVSEQTYYRWRSQFGGMNANDHTAMSRASVGVLRAPVGPVDLDRHALRVGSRVDEVERDVRAGVGE